MTSMGKGTHNPHERSDGCKHHSPDIGYELLVRL